MGSKHPIRPPRIGPGTPVALIAPAGPLLERDDLRRAEELCRALGWDPVMGRHAGAQDGYLAGTDQDRIADLNDALRRTDIGAIWCIRGGYGLTRILDAVDYEALARHPKPILGFSDITALLLAAWHRTGVVTFHGPVARHEMPGFTRLHLEQVLGRAAPAGRLRLPDSPPDTLVPEQGRVIALERGVAEGPLVGGNLSLIQCLLGTTFMPALDGAILFLEDVGEDLYRIDRMLSHLRLAGVLDSLAGVALGRFTEMGRRGADGATGFDQVMAHYFGGRDIPVVGNLPFGHIRAQWTLPIGVRARLDGDSPSLELLDAAVS